MTDINLDPLESVPTNPDYDGAVTVMPGVELEDGVAFKQPTNIGELMATKFPPLRWVVPDLIPEGLTLLAGPPKIGKSWLTFDLALAVATGGECLGKDVRMGSVLLLALEDNGRRIQDRMQKVLPYHDQQNWDSIGENLQIYDTGSWNSMHRIDSGAMKVFEAWRHAADNPRLVIVDVLQKIRPPARSQQSEYDAVYKAMHELHRWASLYRISVIVIHHTKKGGSTTSDPFEAVSGTMGLTASADTTVILSHDPSGDFDGVFYGRGRDLPEFEEPLTFSGSVWTHITGTDALRLSEERRQVVDVIAAGPQSGVGAQDIADQLSKSRNAVDVLLTKMTKANEVRRIGRGVYALPKETQ